VSRDPEIRPPPPDMPVERRPPSVTAHQRLIREQMAAAAPRAAAASLDGYWVETVSRSIVKPIIMRYEWLGSLGRSTVFVGLYSRLAEQRRATKDFAITAVEHYMQTLQVTRDELFSSFGPGVHGEAKPASAAPREVSNDSRIV
jgi:hypothetical protein